MLTINKCLMILPFFCLIIKRNFAAMTVEEFFALSIMETYCLGLTTKAENVLVETMAANYPVIKKEMEQIQVSLNAYIKEPVLHPRPHIKISSVNDGEELMLFLKKKKPDLLFLDLNMPCKNGIECLDEIRAVKSYNYLPVIIYSTTINAAQVDACYSKGASLYLQKPSHFEGIKNSIARILSDGISVLFEQPAKSKFVLKL